MATTLPTRKLGKNGPLVTRLGFGLMGLSSFYGTKKPDEERFKVLDYAYDAGERFWDSADIYDDNEDLLGEYFKRNPDKRKDIFLATKFANVFGSDGSVSVNSTYEYCKSACAKSLSRLQLPNIDLYYVHRINPATPIEETMKAMKELQQEGKIKYLGLSECSSETLRRACKVVHVDAVQVEFSPFSLDIEKPEIDLLKTCRELGTAVVAYSPIGRGMLAGTVRSPDDFEDGDFRKFAPRFSAENFPKNLELVDKIKAVADKKGVTPSQLTLAWLMAQGDDIFPIPGTTKVERLEENLQSLKIELSEEEEKEIRQACEGAEVAGERYPEAFLDLCYVDTVPATA
ncbi:putative aldo-keto reductase [Pleomassaria siparia CBS 279.74]|uniref:Putative aldo-keto reductase n=1 Tax=Pleomassaria siparia CBS 279.74 TaxID=1314801 RepID=A0A6G1JZ06_9PLEO|nr:putative aldo-keto reductase [Pleomassaria siparia CBS 279.74]